MVRCEDYPACGHELGCCPDFDENGIQLNMVCICGAKLPVDNPSSICNGCLRRGGDDGEGYVYDDDYEEDLDDEEDEVEIEVEAEDVLLDEYGHGTESFEALE